MSNLISCVKHVLDTKGELPFCAFSSVKEQKLLNVPIVKPVLVVVLNGKKDLGNDSELICHSGHFVFLSDNPTTYMRNIPKNNEYFALSIEFDYADFHGLQVSTINKQHYCIGETTSVLEKCLQQFVQSTLWTPPTLWPIRRREIIELLCYMGHEEILSMVGHSKVSHRVHEMFCVQNFHGVTTEYLCNQLAMSESTLRRKLKQEGTSIQEIKDQAKLGRGLDLLQTSQYSVGLIAEKCGYLSASKFSERFKNRFGLTPTELRKTKMAD